MPTKEQLKELQSKSLEEKIQISTARIIEWYEHWNGQVYVSFSGGKDSTVLADLVRRFYPDVPCVFADTGLEYPEVRQFAISYPNTVVVRPKMNFKQVIEKYGYPVISKEQSAFIQEYRTTKSEKLKNIRLNGNKYGMGKISKKWFSVTNADFNVSDKCCDIMKKAPVKAYEKQTHRMPIMGTMTDESAQRESNWKMYGCNAFEAKRPTSKPISFWTEQDVLNYIKKYNLEYAPVYGKLIEDENDNLHFTGCQRTGCIFCGFGCHLEKEPNRFQRLEETHPKLHSYCINGGEYNEDGVWIPSKTGLGMGKVLNYIGVDYKPIVKEPDKE